MLLFDRIKPVPAKVFFIGKKEHSKFHLQINLNIGTQYVIKCTVDLPVLMCVTNSEIFFLPKGHST